MLNVCKSSTNGILLQLLYHLKTHTLTFTISLKHRTQIFTNTLLQPGRHRRNTFASKATKNGGKKYLKFVLPVCQVSSVGRIPVCRRKKKITRKPISRSSTPNSPIRKKKVVKPRTSIVIVLHLARSAALHKCHVDRQWQTRNRQTYQLAPPPTHRPLRLDLLHSNRTDLYLEGDIFQCRFVHRLFSHKNSFTGYCHIRIRSQAILT